MGGLFDSVLNTLFPPLCRICGAGLHPKAHECYVCNECAKNFKSLLPPLCPTCGHPLSIQTLAPKLKTCDYCPPSNIYFDTARAQLEYEGVAAKIITLLKFHYKEDLASILVDFLDVTYQEHYQEKPFDLIVPVPLHWSRRWRREFNQSELLGRGLSERTGIPMGEKTLRRKRRTTPQARLKRNKRLANLVGAFTVNKGVDVAGKNILLVDDVYTTGSTVNECARVLKADDANNVSVLTVARTI